MLDKLHFGSIALGALLGVGGVYAVRAVTDRAAGIPSDAGTLRGRIVPGPTNQALAGPTRTNQAPKVGVATLLPYEWGYLVGAGDTAGSIAAAITGDASRYVELMLANPHLHAIGEPGVYLGTQEWNFAPEALTPGTRLILPMPWDRYIDQTGRPRGGPVPFPPDGTGVAPDLDALLSAPAPASASALETGTPPALGTAAATTPPPAGTIKAPAPGAFTGGPRTWHPGPTAGGGHPAQNLNPAPYGQAFAPAAA